MILKLQKSFFSKKNDNFSNYQNLLSESKSTNYTTETTRNNQTTDVGANINNYYRPLYQTQNDYVNLSNTGINEESSLQEPYQTNRISSFNAEEAETGLFNLNNGPNNINRFNTFNYEENKQERTNSNLLVDELMIPNQNYTSTSDLIPQAIETITNFTNLQNQARTIIDNNVIETENQIREDNENNTRIAENAINGLGINQEIPQHVNNQGWLDLLINFTSAHPYISALSAICLVGGGVYLLRNTYQNRIETLGEIRDSYMRFLNNYKEDTNKIIKAIEDTSNNMDSQAQNLLENNRMLQNNITGLYNSLTKFIWFTFGSFFTGFSSFFLYFFKKRR